MDGKTGIYIHIPFCVRKCNYCDFLSFPADERMQDTYVDACIQEIRNRAADTAQKVVADTVFIGGGTPSILSVSNLERLMEAVYQFFEIENRAEISMECNPGTADKEKFQAYCSLGINRISFGVQSAVEEELKKLGRIHSFSDALHSYEMARKCGFYNINIDLMSAIPGQTVESYRSTLSQIAVLQPEHISAYSLIVEEGTPFYDEYSDSPPVDEETDRIMYAYTKEFLQSQGLERYEISNYAQKGFECRHNLKYWSGDDYIGIGLGASSKIGNVRYKNESDLQTYIRQNQEGRDVCLIEEILGIEDEMSEFLILGLRKTKGISLHAFKRKFGVGLEEIYGSQISKFIGDGLLIQKSDQLFLSDRGLDVSNYIFCNLL